MEKFVEIYSTSGCVFCMKAKELLTRKHIAYKEYLMATDEERDAMIVRTNGKRTVPQIFIGGEWIGGYDALLGYDASGALDALISGILPEKTERT